MSRFRLVAGALLLIVGGAVAWRLLLAKPSPVEIKVRVAPAEPSGTARKEPDASEQNLEPPESFASRLQLELGRAATWEGRRQIISELPAEQLEECREALTRILSGSDVDAVRLASLDKLEELAVKGTSSRWLATIISGRVPIEPRRSVRYRMLNTLGRLY